MQNSNENFQSPKHEVMNDHQMFVWASDKVEYFRKILNDNPNLPIETTTKIFGLLKAANAILKRLEEKELIIGNKPVTT